SISETLVVNFEEKRPILYILAIGPEYKKHNHVSRLTYTKNDAEAFVGAFQTQMGENRFFDTVIISKLIGAEATSHNIKLKVVEMANNAKASQGKAMILTYISSHGTVDDKGQFVVVAEDFTRLNEVTFVRYKEDIVDKLATVKGSNRLIFIDACKSGAANSTDAVAMGSKSIDATLRTTYISEKLDELIQASGFITFASCKSDEYSWEDVDWKNGAFTEAMLEAFNDIEVIIDNSGKKIKADKDNDDILTIGEFIDFVRLRVPKMVQDTKKQPQNPIISEKEGLNMSMPFYLLD
ncbi:MAG: caspase domain-containing protein, partial [Saprospiraceae bacterium]